MPGRKPKALVEAEKTIAEMDKQLAEAEARAGSSNRKALAQMDALTEIRTTLDKLEEESHYSYHGGSLTDRIRSLASHWQTENVRVLSRDKAERQDMIVFLRAMVINVESATHASTHHYKDIRLQGIIEVAEHAIRRLRDHEDSFYSRWGKTYPDMFRSDYPVRDILHRLQSAEAENESLRNQLYPESKAEGEPDART